MTRPFTFGPHDERHQVNCLPYKDLFAVSRDLQWAWPDRQLWLRGCLSVAASGRVQAAGVVTVAAVTVA